MAETALTDTAKLVFWTTRALYTEISPIYSVLYSEEVHVIDFLLHLSFPFFSSFSSPSYYALQIKASSI